jgi:hypothetical protein
MVILGRWPNMFTYSHRARFQTVLGTNPDSYERKPSGVNFPCLDVWSAAAAADRINNGEYLKEAEYDTTGKKVTQANREIILELCTKPELITLEDRTQGQELHDHVRGWTLKLLDEKCNDFIKQAVKFVDVDAIDKNNIPLIASLPRSIKRDREFEEVRQEINALMTKGMVGTPGKGIQGDLEILQSFQSKRFEGFVIRGVLAGYFVWFFSSTSFVKGNKYFIKGRVKQHSSNSGTQLNYVKIIKP